MALVCELREAQLSTAPQSKPPTPKDRALRLLWLQTQPLFKCQIGGYVSAQPLSPPCRQFSELLT